MVTTTAAVSAVVVDRALKSLVEQRLDEGERADGPLGTRLVRRTNRTGVAGSAPGSTASTALTAGGLTLAAGIAVGGTLLARPWPLKVGAGLAAGAMASNLVDRASGGGVTDFLPTPLGVLNGADVLLGAGLLLGVAGLVARR